MTRYIVKIDDMYCEWSTITDAPCSTLMGIGRFNRYYQDEYGREGMCELEDRMERVKKKGCSCHGSDDADSLIQGNRCADWLRWRKGIGGLEKTEIASIYRCGPHGHPHAWDKDMRPEND